MNITVIQAQIIAHDLLPYLYAFALFVGLLILLQIIKAVIVTQLHVLAKSTKNKWDDTVAEALNSFGLFFYIAIALSISSQFIVLEPFVRNSIYTITLLSSTYYVVRALQIIITTSLNGILTRTTGEAPDSTILGFLENAFKIALWVGAVILVLQNLGYKVGALLGGLGIAGIAIAFALQNVLIDIFSFFSIYFDKPFKKGDFIKIGHDRGTVEHIGIKTTRIKSLDGEELIISNQELTQTRVNNFRTLRRRRVSFSFGIVYETPLAQVKKVPRIVKKIIDAQTFATFERAHFTSFGDSSLDFNVVYFIESNDIGVYRDAQQSINLQLMETFEKQNIEFAYPTRTIYTKK